MIVKLIKIFGSSLLPEFQDGDFVVISKIPILFFCLKKGDVVVFEHANFGRMIKKVAQVDEDGSVQVLGTHEYSLDSRQLGAIRRQDLVGKVIWHIRRVNRVKEKHS